MSPVPSGSKYVYARLAAKGVLFRDGKVLLLRRVPHDPIRPGEWDLPGGLLDPGETLTEGAQREFREETGIAVTVGPLAHAWIGHPRLPNGRRVPVVVVTYVCSSRSARTPRVDPNEHDRFAWVGVKDLSGFRGPPEHLVAIRRALELSGQGRRRR
jgi:8-oxo-dGTP diphosphatase